MEEDDCAGIFVHLSVPRSDVLEDWDAFLPTHCAEGSSQLVVSLSRDLVSRNDYLNAHWLTNFLFQGPACGAVRAEGLPQTVMH